MGLPKLFEILKGFFLGIAIHAKSFSGTGGRSGRPKDFSGPVVCAPGIIFGELAVPVANAGASGQIVFFCLFAVIVAISQSTEVYQTNPFLPVYDFYR